MILDSMPPVTIQKNAFNFWKTQTTFPERVLIGFGSKLLDTIISLDLTAHMCSKKAYRKASKSMPGAPATMHCGENESKDEHMNKHKQFKPFDDYELELY